MRSIKLVFSCCFVLLLPALCFAAESTVTVRGKGELKVPADIALFNLSVVNEERSSEQALKENSQQVDKVLKALLRAGLVEKEISTGQFTINPVWRSGSGAFSDSARPQIVGFRVANQLQVRTMKLEHVGSFLSAAVEAGGNEVNGLRFELSDPTPYRQDAIREATRQARHDARVLADAAGASLGSVVSISLDDARPVPVMGQRAMFAEMAEGMATPVIPGNVTVQATVVAVYNIKE